MGILRLTIFALFLSAIGANAQSFMYSYIDPCTKEMKMINADMSAPIIIAYYGQVKSFTYEELQNGSFDLWMNDTYLKYKTTSPCQGAVLTTTTTNTSNQVYAVINSVMSITSLDFSSLSNLGNAGGLGNSVGKTANSGTDGVGEKKDKKSDGKKGADQPEKNSTGGSGAGGESQDKPADPNASGSQSGNVGSSGDGQSSAGAPGTGSSGDGAQGGTGQGGGNGGGSGSAGSGSSSNGKSGNGGGGIAGEEKKEEVVDSQKDKDGPQVNVGKAAAGGKASVQKPAILVTGDIVGVQSTRNGGQDARGTMSFTSVKGDGTASIGLSADYMVNARIGNISAIKSWIGVNNKGHKHINLVNASFNYLPKSWGTTGMFIRVNSLKNFTALYGVAGSYGSLFEQEIISTLAIAGFMYKGKLTKSLDATIIAAGIYSPYSKYYNESLFESAPVVIPFLNLNYKMTKTFGVGLTGGGTYIAGQDVINYQVLLGAKLIL